MQDKKEEKVMEEKPHTLAETRAEIKKYADMIEAIEGTSEEFEDCGMVRVDCESAREILTTKATELKEGLLQGLEAKAKQLDE
eukprot:CAMPEP_0184498276 /NCGR_PEP_ID=MMETSP0113_2-20130426/38545_1 /TAXON_ID=91329 /ORGANISM="Norrisiella sphaerica, Strain BC52" /LENGTH=82 /DNA_ID=CAMNT_0026885713 /DNA_START=128 /DNA_END=373 /DNA_ORIENTATION=+